LLKKVAIPQSIVDKLSKIDFAEKKEKNYGISEITLRSLSLTDGAVALVGQFEGSISGVKTTFSVFSNILNIYLDKDGNATFSMVPKLRVSAGQIVGKDFYPVIFKDKVVVLYNDNVKNLERSIDESPDRHDNFNNFALIAATFERDGTVRREIVIDQNKDNFLSLPGAIKEFSTFSLRIPFVNIGGMGQIKKGTKNATVILN
jgi:hypothetical protein